MSENTGRRTRSGNKTKHPGQIVLDADVEAEKALEREAEAAEQARLDEVKQLKKRLAQIEKGSQKEDARRRDISTKSLAGQKRTKDLADADSDEEAGKEGGVIDLGSESEPDIAPIRGRGKGGKGSGAAKKPLVSNTVVRRVVFTNQNL